MQFQLKNILDNENITLKDVLILRHVPQEVEVKKVLPWLATDKPELFNAYQQTQKPRTEKAMQKAKFVASFIGHKPGKALFVGLYEVKGYRSISYSQYWERTSLLELKKYGLQGMTDKKGKCLLFDLILLKFCQEWKGKLIIKWPGIERNWFLWADRHDFEILAISEDSILIPDMPEWNQLLLTWNQLNELPTKWCEKLSQWRGVYYILDVSDGKGYVGSAYGKDNLHGRWHNYADSGHGGNNQLKERNPENFRFSILQRVSPDMESSDVQFIEKTWKDRLHTRELGLNDKKR
ncbi:MAG: hypothetical protein JW787_12055 [Sedimentisphaerales bacterium]|nr:hypothetical protein [Sedimentisphaerales bacterium]